MPETTAELRLKNDFNEVCHLLIRRPQVLLPAAATKAGSTEWRIEHRTGTRPLRRTLDILITLEPLAISDRNHATMKLHWRIQRRRSDDGSATIHVDALSRPPSPCTVLTVAIERPVSSGSLLHVRQRHSMNDLIHRHVHHLADSLSAEVTASSEQTLDDDIEVPLAGWTNDHPSRQERQ